MKLVYRILLHLLWVLTLLLAGWAALFYFTLIDEVNDEVDDALEARAEVIVKRVLAGRELPETSADGNTGYYLHEVSAEYAEGWAHERYTDEEIYIPERDDEEPARVLRQTFRDASGRWYELTVMTPSIEKEDLLEAIFYGILYLYLFLLLSVLLVTVVVVNRMMRPLYALLRWLDDYRIGRPNAPLVVETSVTEFRRLNDAAMRSAQRAESSFERQKQFIGNASHEMQTPLAVCRNRLELLAADPELSERQLGEVIAVLQTLEGLTRMNRTLLLLSKIDNGQFPEHTPVCLNEVLKRHLESYAEIYGHLQIGLTVEEPGRMECEMNDTLAEMLVTNLLKNAYVHNRPQGSIRIRFDSRSMLFANSGDPLPFDEADLFKRFRQGGRREDSTGLGLALVDSICRRYGLRLVHVYAEGEHRFTVSKP